MPNAFSKYFEGKIFTNDYRFVKFVKIFPSKKPVIRYVIIAKPIDIVLCRCLLVGDIRM